MVPEEWKLGSLSDLADTVMGFAFKSADFTEAGVPLLRMGNLYQNALDLRRNPVFLPEKFKAEYKRFLVKPGDLVMSMTGTMGKRDYGFAVKIPEGAPDLLLNQRVMKFIPKGGVSSGYLLNLLRSELILSRLYSFPGGTKQANLSAKQVQDLPAPIPPHYEQKKIATILSTWDKAITATERLLENSQQWKKGLMQQLLTGKKRLPGFEGERETVELGSLGSTYSGLSGKTKEDFGYGEPFVTYMGVFSDGALKTNRFDYVRLCEGESQNKVQYGDILFTTSSETPEEVGMASVLLENLPYNLYLNSFCFGFRPHSFDNLVPEYARYLFRGEEMRRRISTLAQGATRYNLSKKQLIKLNVLLPGKAEQSAISEVLATSDAEIAAVRGRLIYLREEKKALMQQLLTGKRRVQVEKATA